MFSFLLSLSLGFGAISQRDLPVDRVEKIAHEVIANLKADNPSIDPTLVVTRRPEPTPLGAMAYSNGSCALIINPTDEAWAQWGRFINSDNTSKWDEIIAASIAHEVGHCMEEGKRFTSNYEITGDTLRALGGVNTAMWGSPSVVFKQELFADAIAVLYAKAHFGEDSQYIVDNLIQSRARFGHDDPSHNTSRELTAFAMAEDAVAPMNATGTNAVKLLEQIH